MTQLKATAALTASFPPGGPGPRLWGASQGPAPREDLQAAPCVPLTEPPSPDLQASAPARTAPHVPLTSGFTSLSPVVFCNKMREVSSKGGMREVVPAPKAHVEGGLGCREPCLVLAHSRVTQEGQTLPGGLGRGVLSWAASHPQGPWSAVAAGAPGVGGGVQASSCWSGGVAPTARESPHGTAPHCPALSLPGSSLPVPL